MSVNPSEKEVARTALRAINPLSIQKNVEYFLFIYRLNGKYAATEPVTSEMKMGVAKDQVDAAYKSIPKGAVATAMAHTHGADEPGVPSLLFTSDDIELAKNMKLNSYLATPSRELVILDHRNSGFYPREQL